MSIKNKFVRKVTIGGAAAGLRILSFSLKFAHPRDSERCASIHSRPSTNPNSIAFWSVMKASCVRIVTRTSAESPRRIS